MARERKSLWLLAAYAGLLVLARTTSERRKPAGVPARSGSRATGDPSSPNRDARFGGASGADEPRHVQHKRAGEPGRGRGATAPWDIPWRGWKDILWRSYQQLGEDRLTSVAAGVVYFGLLALFPAVTAFVSLYGLFADWGTISEHLSLAAGFMPSGAIDIIGEQVTRVTGTGDAKLGFGFLSGLALALWSANAGMKAVIDALNVIYDEKEKRGFIRLNLVSLTFTLGAIAALLVAVGAVVVLPVLLATVGLSDVSETLLRILRWPALFLMIMLGLAVIYRFGPSRDQARWQWLSVGSVAATALWLISSAALSFYLENFAHYDATYGSLGAAIGLMLWMWISSVVILLGAELNSEIEHQTARDTTVGAHAPMGARGAIMADTVGEAAE